METNYFPFYEFMGTVGVWVPFDFAEVGGNRCDGGNGFIMVS